MHVEQYVYLGLRSTTMDPDQISEHIGLAPDRTSIRGSKHPEHDIPRTHLWALECRDPYLWVNDLLDRVAERVSPAMPAIRALVEAGEVDAVVEVVRKLSPDPHGGEERPFAPNEAGEIPPEDRNLLGWHLERRHLEFILAIGAELDVDEYDLTDYDEGTIGASPPLVDS